MHGHYVGLLYYLQSVPAVTKVGWLMHGHYVGLLYYLQSVPAVTKVG